MMSGVNWGHLAVETLRDPKSAARQILAWGVPRDVLWQALALVAIANSLTLSAASLVLPSPNIFLTSSAAPIVTAIATAVILVVFVISFCITGRFLGAKGAFNDLLVLLIWLQALKAVLLLIVMVITFFSQQVAEMIFVVASLTEIWITLNFVAVALQLNSLWRAAAVMVVTVFGLALCLIFLLPMFGI